MAEMKGVSDLATDLDLEAHIVRTKLRQAGIEKSEGKYQWSAKEYASVLKQLKTGAKAEPADEPKGKKGKTKETKAEAAAPENKGKGGKVRPKPAGSK